MLSSRLKMSLFLLWVFVCCKIWRDGIIRVDLWHAFLVKTCLYYCPLILVTIMVWLWGLNLWVFDWTPICFCYDRILNVGKNHLTHRDIWKVATWMTIVIFTSMTACLHLFSLEQAKLASSQPVFLYFAFPIVLVLPLDMFYFSSRYWFLRTLYQIVFPVQAVTFTDVFLADILTSMARIFSVLERSVCRIAYQQQVVNIPWYEADSKCSPNSVLIPFVLVLPFMFRLFQCLRLYKDTRKQTELFNALKYLTVLPVIILSALKFHVDSDMWANYFHPLWFLSVFVNCSLSFYWDVSQDWDWSGFGQMFMLNKGIRECRKTVFALVCGSNLVLYSIRTVTISTHMRYNFLLLITFTLLEMIRRWLWIFFRVEKEWNKMVSQFFQNKEVRYSALENYLHQ